MEETAPPGTIPFGGRRLQLNNTGTKCATCRHWWLAPPNPQANLKAPRQGLCKLNPPQVILLGLATIQAPMGAPPGAVAKAPQFAFMFPETIETEYCGQHTARGDG